MNTTEFLAIRRAQAITVHRPRGVIHAYVGPRTPSGWFVPRSRRTVCRARTRRLVAVAPSAASTMCARCSARLASSIVGRAEHSLVTRDDHLAAYGHLTIRDLFYATALTSATAETYTVGYLARLLFGPEPMRIHAGSTLEQRQLFDLNARILKARRHWEAAELTDEQRQAIAAKRETDDFNDRVVAAGRKKADQRDRALDRATRGSYLTPYERSLVS